MRIVTISREFGSGVRNADVLLSEYHPFHIFVCADMDAKVRRCLDMVDENEKLSRKEMGRPGFLSPCSQYYRLDNQRTGSGSKSFYRMLV